MLYEVITAIKEKLDKDGFRDSSNNKYTIGRVVSLIRPIYSGYLKQGLSYSHVENVEPIVTLPEYKTAKKKLDGELKKIKRVQ